MRAWRKLHATVLDSEQVARLSDSAAWLLALLIVAQDDSGYWPWTPAKVRRLIAARPNWSIASTTKLATELVEVGIAEWRDGGIVLLRGQELNGRYRSDTQPELYTRDTPRIHDVDTADTPRMSRVEKSRVEERVEKSRVEGESVFTFSPSPPTPSGEPLDSLHDTQEVRPDWYATLWAIPGFRVPLGAAAAWLAKKGISEGQAESAAYALKGKWPGPPKSPYRDVWATFQNWVKREGLNNGGGAERSRRPNSAQGVDAQEDPYADWRKSGAYVESRPGYKSPLPDV